MSIGPQFVELPAAPAAFPWPDRALRLPQWVGIEGDARAVLQAARVLLVGQGAIGRSAAEQLASLGVGTLLLVDRDFHQPASLLTTAIGPDDIGVAKPLSAGRWCKAIAPDVRVLAFHGPLAAVPLATMLGSVVVLATDNLAVEAEVGRRCTALGLRLAQAAVLGPVDLVQVRMWRNADAASPCPACRFSEREWAMADREVRLGCAGQAAGGMGPTMSTRALASAAAGLLVTQLKNWLLGLDQLDDLEVSWQGTSCRTTRLRCNERCRCEHRRWVRIDTPRPLSAYCVNELVQLAVASVDLTPRDDEPLVEVEGHSWVEEGVCTCPRMHAVARFVAIGTISSDCARCKRPVAPLPYTACRSVRPGRLGAAAHAPLAEIGADTATGVIVTLGDAGRVLLSVGPEAEVLP